MKTRRVNSSLRENEAIFVRYSCDERLCILLTLRCNLACSHCNVNASPQRLERLSSAEVLEVLVAGRNKGKSHVTFSGGETFLEYDDLLRYTDYATRMGYEVDVETNAFWATSQAETEDRLAPLFEAGLRGICLSVDKHHLEFIPLDRSINAYRVASSIGMLTEVNFCPSEDAVRDAQILQHLHDAQIPYLFNRLLKRGRAANNGQWPTVSFDCLPDCDSLNLTVHPSGDLFACCELDGENESLRLTPVFLGKLRFGTEVFEYDSRLERLVAAFHDPQSPAYFRNLFRQDPAFRDIRNCAFSSICDLCFACLRDSALVACVQAKLDALPQKAIPNAQTCGFTRSPWNDERHGVSQVTPPVQILNERANRNESQEGICFDFPNRVKINFVLTYQCNAACAHCITESGPERREWLGEEEVAGMLKEGIRFGKKYVAFTGGEPFLRYDMLLSLVNRASQLGYFVVADTNAFWATSPRLAEERVQELRDAGLRGLFPGADPYHLRFVALECVQHVMRACDEIGLTCEVNFCPGPDAIVNTQILQVLGLQERGFFCDGLSLTGRDVDGIRDYFPSRAAAEISDVGSMHLGVSPRGDCYCNVDISYACDEFKDTAFVLGNLRRDGGASILERERSCGVVRAMEQFSPADIDSRLLMIDKFGERYREIFERRKYYSATAYWLDLLTSNLRVEIESLLQTWAPEWPPEVLP